MSANDLHFTAEVTHIKGSSWKPYQMIYTNIWNPYFGNIDGYSNKIMVFQLTKEEWGVLGKQLAVSNIPFYSCLPSTHMSCSYRFFVHPLRDNFIIYKNI